MNTYIFESENVVMGEHVAHPLSESLEHPGTWFYGEASIVKRVREDD